MNEDEREVVCKLVIVIIVVDRISNGKFWVLSESQTVWTWREREREEERGEADRTKQSWILRGVVYRSWYDGLIDSRQTRHGRPRPMQLQPVYLWNRPSDRQSCWWCCCCCCFRRWLHICAASVASAKGMQLHPTIRQPVPSRPFHPNPRAADADAFVSPSKNRPSIPFIVGSSKALQVGC